MTDPEMDITSHVSPAFSSSCYTVSPSSPASIQSEKISVDVLTLSQTVNSAGGLSLDTNAHSKVWRRIDIHIIPVVAMFYLLSFLDRTNLANARVAGLQADLGLSNYQYCIALTVTFIPYIIIEIPSNLVLKALGPNLLLPTILTLWGVVTTLQGTVKSYSGLLVCRFFLGLFEGGVYPGLVLYLSFWYPRHQLQRRISAFFSTASLSGAFSSLLAYGIINLDGVANHPGWAWIFILEGLFTVLFGIFAFWALPRNPEDARWLSEGERKWVVRMVLEGEGKEEKKDGDEEGEERFKWEQVGRVFAAPQMWMLAVLFFLNGVQIYGLAYFTPSIVHGLGYSAAYAQLYSVPPFAVAFVLTMIGAHFSDRYGARGFVTAFAGVVATVGFGMFFGSSSLHVKYASLFLSISGAYNISPTVSTWAANNFAPYTRRATSIALGIGLSNCGGIVATWLFGTISPPPEFRTATITLLVSSVVIVLVTGMNNGYLYWHNKRKEERRKAIGRREDEERGLGDRSAWFVYSL